MSPNRNFFGGARRIGDKLWRSTIFLQRPFGHAPASSHAKFWPPMCGVACRGFRCLQATAVQIVPRRARSCWSKNAGFNSCSTKPPAISRAHFPTTKHTGVHVLFCIHIDIYDLPFRRHSFQPETVILSDGDRGERIANQGSGLSPQHQSEWVGRGRHGNTRLPTTSPTSLSDRVARAGQSAANTKS